jgi:hypothetical protein
VSGLLNSLVHKLTGNHFYDKLLTEDGIETKKCMNCLRRCGLDWIKCPYCGFTNFHISEN